MDNNNWRPTTNQGPVGGTGGGGVGGEPNLDAGDWRNQLQPDSRSRIVDKMPRNPVSSLQQGQLPPLHMDSMQQPQSPINHIQSQDNQMNPQLLSVAGHTNGGDWQEEAYQKIKVMKEMYVPELNEMYQKITTKLQQHDSLPQQPKLEQLDKLKQFKNVLERIITFLGVSKSDISLNMKEKLVSYEKQILHFTTTSRPRNPVSSLQQGQLPPLHMDPMQQPQSQINHTQSQDNQMNPQLPSVTGHTNGGDWQEEVYQKIKVMKEMYVPELNEMYQKITTKLQQHDSLPQQPKLEQLDKLKQFKNMLERIITFLGVSKSDISLNMKEKLVSYEKQILHFITTSRPRNPVSSLMGMTSQVHNQGQSLPIPLSANSQARQQVMSQNIQNSVASAGVQTSACLPSSLPDLNAEYCWPED